MGAHRSHDYAWQPRWGSPYQWRSPAFMSGSRPQRPGADIRAENLACLAKEPSNAAPCWQLARADGVVPSTGPPARFPEGASTGC
jgi:hypothetical protein